MYRNIKTGRLLIFVAALAACGNLCRAQESQDGVTVHSDIVYSAAGGEQLKLDVYQPETDGPHSAVLVVHGGAWKMGDRRQLQTYARLLAERGHCCFAISYRLAPEHKFPAQIEDCRSAVRWIRQNAQKYQVDPGRLGAIGYSAGGHLVALLGTTGEAPSEQNGHSDTRLQAVAAGGAPCDFCIQPFRDKRLGYWLGGTYEEKKKNFEQASPALFASEDDAPMIFFNGTADSLVPPEWTLPLYNRLKKLGVPSEFHRVEGAGHLAAAGDRTALKKAFEFLDTHLAGKKAAEN